MRNFLATSIFCAVTTLCFAAPPTANVRTIEDIPGLQAEPLRSLLSAKFYKSLRLSRVDGWIAVRGALVGNRMTGAKIVHSELNGAYDSLALEKAKEWELKGSNPELGTYIPHTVIAHLLIYQLKNGKMALSFIHLDDPGGNEFSYYGEPWIAVEKNGKWEQVNKRHK
jgi:hypothetical protein